MGGMKKLFELFTEAKQLDDTDQFKEFLKAMEAIRAEYDLDLIQLANLYKDFLKGLE